MEHRRDSIRRAKALLGTFVEIHASGCSAEKLQDAAEAAFDAIAKVHRLMSFHDPGSDVGQLNRHAFAGEVAVDPWTFRVLETALELHERSGGVFDITAASGSQRKGLIQLLSRNRVRFGSPGVQVDLGGIAKGFAVDRAIEVLKQHKIQCGLVNAGGDIASFGPEAHPVQIRNPADPRQIFCEIALADAALATSGPRFNALDYHGVGTIAAIDPETLCPSRAAAGVTVCAPTCIIADALTKVVLIAGEEAGSTLDWYRADALMISAELEVRFTAGLQGVLTHAA